MRAKITKEFRVAPEGHTVIICDAGMIVSGRLAQRAISAGYAEPVIEVKPDAAPMERKPEIQQMQIKRRGRPRKGSQ